MRHGLLTARNGDEVDYLSQVSEGGLVISNIVMPGMSGPEWVQTAGDMLTDVPVAYTVGYSDIAQASHGWLRSAETPMKPFRVGESARVG